MEILLEGEGVVRVATIQRESIPTTYRSEIQLESPDYSNNNDETGEDIYSRSVLVRLSNFSSGDKKDFYLSLNNQLEKGGFTHFIFTEYAS